MQAATPEELARALCSKYGDSYVTRERKLRVERVCSGLLSVDRVLGGGVPRGRVLEVYGPPSAGKTSLALQFAKAYQRAGHTVVWQDLEGSTDFERAEACGVDTRPGYWNFLSTQESVITGERALQMVLDACELGVGLVVVDSVPGLVPAVEAEKSFEEGSGVGTLARLLSRALPRVTAACLQTHTTVVFINQTRSKITAYGGGETTAGGVALEFYSSVRLSVRLVEPLTKPRPGQRTRVVATKNKTARPRLEGEFDLYYDSGCDELSSLANALLQSDLVQRSGSWYSLTEAGRQLAQSVGYTGADRLGQGAHVVAEWLQAHPAVYEAIYKALVQSS